MSVRRPNSASFMYYCLIAILNYAKVAKEKIFRCKSCQNTLTKAWTINQQWQQTHRKPSNQLRHQCK